MIDDFRRTSDGFEMNIEDGREPEDFPDDGSSCFKNQDYNTSIKVRASSEKKKTFLIELQTSHYAFNSAESSTARTVTEFYQLQGILKVIRNHALQGKTSHIAHIQI